MADEEQRELERRAAQGDLDAQERLRHIRCRVGDHCGCSQPIGAQIGIRYRAVGTVLHNDTDLMFDDNGDQPDAEHYEMVLTIDLGSDERNTEILRRLARRLGVPEPDLSDPVDRQCSYCDAAPGSQCVTSSGKNATKPHAFRNNPAKGLIQVEDHRQHSSVYDIFGGDNYDDTYYEMH